MNAGNRNLLPKLGILLETRLATDHEVATCLLLLKQRDPETLASSHRGQLNLIICLECLQRPVVFAIPSHALVQNFNPNFWSTFNIYGTRKLHQMLIVGWSDTSKAPRLSKA